MENTAIGDVNLEVQISLWTWREAQYDHVTVKHIKPSQDKDDNEDECSTGFQIRPDQKMCSG